MNDKDVNDEDIVSNDKDTMSGDKDMMSDDDDMMLKVIIIWHYYLHH